MFPAPSTRAVWTPNPWTVSISAASASTRARSIPYCCRPRSASPESFSRMRSKAAAPSGTAAAISLSTSALTGRSPASEYFAAWKRVDSERRSLSERVADEVADLSIVLCERFADGEARIVDPGLLVEDGLREKSLRQPAFDDLALDVVRLPFEIGQLLEDRALRLDLVDRHLVPGDEAGIREGDVHCDHPRKLRGCLGADEDADLLGWRMDVRGQYFLVLGFETSRSHDLDVLSDPRDQVHTVLLEGLHAFRARFFHRRHDALDKTQKLVVLRDGLRLASHGDDRAN